MGLVNTWSSPHRDLPKNRLCSGNSGSVPRSRDCRCELSRWRRQAWASLSLRMTMKGHIKRDGGGEGHRRHRAAVPKLATPTAMLILPAVHGGSEHWSCVNSLNFYSTLRWWVLLSSLF